MNRVLALRLAAFQKRRKAVAALRRQRAFGLQLRGGHSGLGADFGLPIDIGFGGINPNLVIWPLGRTAGPL